MNTKLAARFGVILLAVITISAPGVQAATLAQSGTPAASPTPLPTPSPAPPPPKGATPLPGDDIVHSPAGASPQPTATLSPPPVGGGRVAADALYVRDNASFGAEILGLILYNQSVYPVGRNANSTWIAVKWGSAQGWVYAGLVVWDSALDLNGLPVLAPASYETPTTGPDATATGPAAATEPGVTPTEPPSVEPSATPTPTATSTLEPSPTTVQPTQTASPAPAALPANTPPAQPSSDGKSATWPGRLPSGLWIGGGLLLLGTTLYVWRRVVGSREIRRYAHGFIFEVCPVCQEGRIHLDETVRYSLGIPHVIRSARCNTCRSVLRETQPGRWRYMIDTAVNRAIGLEFDRKQLTVSELKALAARAIDEWPADPEAIGTAAYEALPPSPDEDI